MTVETLTNRIIYTGNGTVGPFDINFPFLADADIVAIKTLIAAPYTEMTLILNTDYTLTGAGDEDGGALTLSAAQALLITSSYKLTIYRDPAVTQGVDYTPNDGFPAETHERALDKLTMIGQRVKDLIARSFRISDGDTSGIDTTMPTPVASAVLSVNAARTALAWVLQSGVLAVSAFGQTLLNAANAAAARALLLISASADYLLLNLAIAAKGDLIAGTAANQVGALTVGANGKALVADSSQTTGLIYIDNPSRPILNINPNWKLDQINEGGLYTSVSGSLVLGPDGIVLESNGAGVFKIRKVVDPDCAALSCIEITCTTIDAAIAAADTYSLLIPIEGTDSHELMIGTASALAATTQFKFKSNLNGVYGMSYANAAKNRRYVSAACNVVGAAEAEFTFSPVMDLAGTWLYTNGVGLYWRLVLAAGTNFQTATPNAWAAGAEQTTAAQVNFMSSVANIAYLKRTHIIPGALVQAYRPADIQKELARAQRQYFKTYEQGVVIGTVTSIGVFRGGSIANNAFINRPRKVTMRAIPTDLLISPVTGTGGNIRNETAGADVAAGANATYTGTNLLHVSVALAGANDIFAAHHTADARLK